MVAGGGPESCLRIQLRDDEVLEEPGSTEFVSAEAKSHLRRIFPEEFAFAGKEIELAMPVFGWVWSRGERNDDGGFAIAVTKEVGNAERLRDVRASREVVD